VIKITVELFPFGLESSGKILSIMKIWNDGTGTKTKGNYRYRMSKTGRYELLWKEGEVKNFPRKRLNVWYLLLRVLSNALDPGQIK
jgi:hypothetical protein